MPTPNSVTQIVYIEQKVNSLVLESCSVASSTAVCYRTH